MVIVSSESSGGENLRSFFIVEDVKTVLQARNRHIDLSYAKIPLDRFLVL